MSIVLSKQLIFDRIRDSKYPYWCLGLVQGFKNVSNVMCYYGNDFLDTDSEDEKLEKSIRKLDAIVSSFPDDSLFEIEIKNAKNANGSGVIGAFQFTVKDTKTQPQTTILNGYSDSYLKGIEESLNKKFEIKLAEYKADVEKKQREKEFLQREKELEEREKELKELKRAYDSGVAKSADVLVLAGKKILGYVFPDLISNDTPATQLGEPEFKDEKTEMLDKLAEFMYENCNLQTISDFYEKLKKVKNESKLQKQNTSSNTTADTATNSSSVN